MSSYLGLISSQFSNQPLKSAKSEIEILNPHLFVEYKDLEQRMTNYCNQFCNITPDQMKTFIRHGELLENKISTGAIKFDQGRLILDIDTLLTPQEAVVSLMWLFMAKAGVYEEQYTNGAFRIDDPDRKIQQFIEQCGQQIAPNAIYPRISTHMHEYIPKKEGQNQSSLQGQFGLDLNALGLPAKKNAILFHALPDNTLYIKMELAGCPPFWKTKYLSLKNIKEFAAHSTTYLITRIKPSGEMKPTRKEHVPKEIKKLFSSIIAPKPSSTNRIKKFFNSIAQLFNSPTKQAEKEAKKGISHIHQRLTALPTDEKVESLQTLIKPYLDRKAERDYQGEIKGEEVILPALNRSLFSIKQISSK